MDGPVIQRAVEHSLEAGTRVRDVFTAVQAVAALGVPVLVMTYWNPVLRYGVETLRARPGRGRAAPGSSRRT